MYVFVFVHIITIIIMIVIVLFCMYSLLPYIDHSPNISELMLINHPDPSLSTFFKLLWALQIHPSTPARTVVLASAIATVYAAWWDVCMDWGLTYTELCFLTRSGGGSSGWGRRTRDLCRRIGVGLEIQ